MNSNNPRYLVTTSSASIGMVEVDVVREEITITGNGDFPTCDSYEPEEDEESNDIDYFGGKK